MSPAFHQLTVSVRVTLWLKADEPEPVVPVTVKVEVPAGVPGFDVTVLRAPPPPPPQDASDSVRSSPRANMAMPYRHRFTPEWLRRTTADAKAASSKATISKPLRLTAEGGSGPRSREPETTPDEAVVATLTVMFVAEVPGMIELGETVHVVSAGAPVQVNWTA